ncbi:MULTISPECIES: hypothetical protein [Chryseobacterium]|uniref:Bacteriocin-like protein n=1 Tax=Chryseobacterium geocarposphaerae TaxID=1416776 RepID=A0ABU1LDU8_9FLAO|nr:MULTISPECIES: hypothetical protein [Chryseobacterium]MDR6404893.1 hypothetical protein [Chryseobacterium geocarposphaerae]MDR6697676.1 hypothetical protein [Chryseobacterium ginsenosidimutans]
MRKTENFKNKATKLSKSAMKEINGGMKHTPCRSYNVEDRRPGASALWIQKLETFAHNFMNCPDHL